MYQYYRDYYWKNGLAVGLSPFKDEERLPMAYKILQDSYKRHISVEKYTNDTFTSVVYDSGLLDFRKLNPREQKAWSKQMIHKEGKKITHLIRDIDDRAIFLEESLFENDLCVECKISSSHGIYLGKTVMFYKENGEPFDGAVFFDPENRPVVIKKYTLEKREFQDLLTEEWDMSNAKNFL